ncbi:hypothetical protein, variant 6 [Cryptococcus amylolentus CBS 6039]|uniref:Uncharacterized protein n=1 Tax=Cryptococcus amylolentus CBS 6039 TaxID=1295533 RepID=A0A1E3HGX0_9TREE|nr:hypothetical protein, variant 4 [Cryptococcus amylolentus CBS 6039]XP_018991240.1 hypothetical protein, variant 5 [Cryptococcus amylolentus CBS 6039]XP_018991241.1 hypothetical protein, variant 6 [Cryptococcus amylolentus CBS 6039]ODN75589.1 hypothetical protein, variant 4 [Cryptococcus amylolentus CBS 6039]ODN75590.1 hypothetical protein, variant 5 [Cryptococcus amylolentus CBS 6039]ODN75591.1 hypothetical protein, variant 6 [Cryptococcus amylolentus CBS 6039]
MVGTSSKQNTGEEEGLLSGDWAEGHRNPNVTIADGQRGNERQRGEVDDSQDDDRKAYTLVQVDPPGASSSSTYPPPATTEQMITQWVDSQVTYSEIWPFRQRVIYAVLSLYCIIAEIAPAVTLGEWGWGVFFLWIATSLLFLLGHLGVRKGRAAALESVNLVAERMRSLMYTAQESRDNEILEFLDDKDISPPPFSPIPPSILLFANNHKCQFDANVGLGISILPFYVVFTFQMSRILVNFDPAAPFVINFILEPILVIPLFIYANQDPHDHLCGGLDKDGAKLQWAWHKKHFQWWGTKAVKDALQPDAISSLKKATAPHDGSNSSSSTTTAPASDVSSLSMDVLQQELQKRMEDVNIVVDELQRKMKEGDEARRAYMALSGTNSNQIPPSYD